MFLYNSNMSSICLFLTHTFLILRLSDTNISIIYSSFCSMLKYTISKYITAPFCSFYRCISTLTLVSRETLLQMTCSLRHSLLNSCVYIFFYQLRAQLVSQLEHCTLHEHGFTVICLFQLETFEIL